MSSARHHAPGNPEEAQILEADSPPELEARLEALQQENAELREQLKRAAADYENYRRRLQEDAERRKDMAAEEIICELLEVLDHLEMALTAANASAKDKDLQQGVELIHRQIKKILEKQGLQEIPAEGCEFDPYQHEAVEAVEVKDKPDNSVHSVLRRGYKLKNKVIRPSMVKVCRKIKDNKAKEDKKHG